MTRHNLNDASYLPWLLKLKPSNPPETSSLPPAPISFPSSTPSQTAITESTLTARSSDAPFGQSRARGIDTEPFAQQDVPESLDQTRANMAKLRTATGSATKPTLVSMMADVPTMRKAQSERKVPKQDLGSPARSKKTSAHQHQKFRMSSDVEIMDLTDNLSPRKSPKVSKNAGLSSSRKRKSSEFDLHPSPSHSAQRAKTDQYSRRASQHSFTEIDDLAQHAMSPPPPYSTVAPVQPAPSRSIHESATRETPNQRRILPDSEDEEGGDQLFDVIRNDPRSFQEVEESPSKSRTLAIKSVEDGRNSPCKDPGSISAYEKQPITTSLLPPAKSQESTPLSEQQSLLESVRPADAKLLRRVLSLKTQTFELLLALIEARKDELIEEMAMKMEEEPPAETEQEQEELDDLDIRTASIQSLQSKRGDHARLLFEKDTLFAALKHAIKVKQPRTEASNANMAGKAALSAFEAKCWQELVLCRRDFEEHFAATCDDSHPSHSVAIESTQAPPIPMIERTSNLPSPGRVAQTQVSRPPLKQIDQGVLRSPTERIFEIDSPTRNRPGVSYPTKHHEAFNAFRYDDIPETRMSMSIHRMGTPPAQAQDDYGDFVLEDEDVEMLEFADQSEIPRSAPPQRLEEFKPSKKVEQSSSKPAQNRASRVQASSPKANAAEVERRYASQPWFNDVKTVLREKFLLHGFRVNQLETIAATLSGKDTFVLMPTGGGKSLCFQLPALIRTGKTRGVTVVVSPLLSLMEDQVQKLRSLRVQAFLVNAATPMQERDSIMAALREPDAGAFIQLLYVTPEMLSKSSKLLNVLDDLYRRNCFARMVVDESHCLSQWGNSFRSDYLCLGEVRQRFRRVPVMALTATATENVKVDIIDHLGMEGASFFTSSFNRPNLFYSVLEKAKSKQHVQNIAKLIKESHHNQTGIVYCFSRKECEAMAKSLREQHNIKANHYHAGMQPEEKAEVQSSWQAGETKVAVATIALGMGIDVPNVRFIIHASIPKSLEGYYQETGRAGRDQLSSRCYLYFSYADVCKIRRMIDAEKNVGWEQKRRQQELLQKMTSFADNKMDCRRTQILGYFNENFSAKDCRGQCDNCISTLRYEEEDLTEFAQLAVNLVEEIEDQMVTVLNCVDILRGSDTGKVRGQTCKSFPNWGAASALDRRDIERLFYRLMSEDVLQEKNVANKTGFAHQYVKLGRESRKYNSRGKQLMMTIRTTPGDGPKRTAPRPKRSRKEMPSTNVSSPVEAFSSRRGQIMRRFARKDDDGESSAEESDGFEPVRVAEERQKARPLGPRITDDGTMAGLDELHRMTVQDFMIVAKSEVQKIMTKKTLKNPPFSDTILREMAVRFTKTEAEMLRIPGINPEKVRIYGDKFCELVKNNHKSYREMMGVPDDPVVAPDQHAQNVIDLVSDDGDDYGSMHDSDFDENERDEGEPSAYFKPNTAKRVEDFNAQFAQSQSAAMRTKAAAPPPRKKPSLKGKKRQFTESSNKGGGWRRSNDSGVTKKGRKFSGNRGESSRASGSKAKKAGGGIPMMPT